MKNARMIIKEILKLNNFDTKGQEENVKIALYTIFKWSEENEHRLICMVNPFETDGVLNLAFFFNPDGKCNIVVPGVANELFLEVNIKKDTKDLYDKLMYCLHFLFTKMKEISDDDVGDTGFLGGDYGNDFF